MRHLLCLGDSITCADRLFGSGPLGEGYVSMLPPLLKDFEIRNKGMDGFTISRILQNIQADRIDLKTDLVTIQAGINNIGLMMNTDRSPTQQKKMLADAVLDHTALLKKIAEQTRAGIILLEPFVFPHPEEFATWIPLVKELSGHIRELADIFGCAFLPLHDLLNQEARRLGFAAITTDGIHLTRAGHAIVAQQLARCINNEISA